MSTEYRTARIELIREKRVVQVFFMGMAPFRIGRSPGNEIRLMDSEVSGHHAELAWVEGRLMVSDLGSRNGTQLNGKPVTRRQPINAEDQLVIAGCCALRLHLNEPIADIPEAWVLHDLDAGTARMFQDGRCALLNIEGELNGVVLVHAVSGEFHVEGDPSRETVPVMESFEIGGRTFEVRADRSNLSSTSHVAPACYAYRLDASLDGGGRVIATLRCTETGRAVLFQAPNRALLLFLLGARRLDALESNLADSEAGWVDDDDLRREIWGALRHTMTANNLLVLVSRVRKDLHNLGLDGWCVQKRRCQTRLCVAEVQLKGNLPKRRGDD